MLLLFLFPERLLEVQNSISDSSWHVLGWVRSLGLTYEYASQGKIHS